MPRGAGGFGPREARGKRRTGPCRDAVAAVAITIVNGRVVRWQPSTCLGQAAGRRPKPPDWRRFGSMGVRAPLARFGRMPSVAGGTPMSPIRVRAPGCHVRAWGVCHPDAHGRALAPSKKRRTARLSADEGNEAGPRDAPRAWHSVKPAALARGGAAKTGGQRAAAWLGHRAPRRFGERGAAECTMPKAIWAGQ